MVVAPYFSIARPIPTIYEHIWLHALLEYALFIVGMFGVGGVAQPAFWADAMSGSAGANSNRVMMH